ncbi:hypothetical protein PYH37_006171 (plasmid) [Sinorhizobium numidicum]|uniref:Uncharacterized protein n=1 Tax=Sinorhizobium numidicum TaxID=680248 RepID=A0ABY8D359_9HYPH|nr:hypothetical protein [Sinorhizobium numidicum]WEX79308.1 hypothetical protein PYH37_006171 [Sinorhizobium numidicum]WEX85321.1 hypothetical protein PYH38_006214 [Sinorhizobium numidicum]
MLAVQSLAIVITDPQKTISTGEKCFPAALGVVDGTSVLRRLLSQLARAGVQRAMVLAQGTLGDIASDLGGELDGMELCLRALPTPNAGRLVDAATIKEIAHVDRDVLVFTENVVIEFELIERLLRLQDRNIAVVSKTHGRRSLRILADDALRLTAILPDRALGQDDASADSNLLGVYKFDPAFVRAIARNSRHRTHDDLEFFETALGIHAHPIHIMCAEPHQVKMVNDAVDLAAANFAFRSSSHEVSTVERTLGH